MKDGKASGKKSGKSIKDSGVVKGVFSGADSLAYKIFHKSIERNPGRYHRVETNLKQAKKAIPVEVYIPRALLFASVGMLAGALGGVLLALFMSGMDWSSVPFDTFRVLLSNKIFMTVLFGGLLAGIGFAVVYNLFLIAPKLSASSRAQEIDNSLTDAVVYMFAMSQGGKNILEMFHVISEHPNIFKEMSKEVESVVREVELLGVDLQTALHDLALFTPAKNFKEFLESLASMVSTGGDLPLFFRNRAEQLRIEASQQNRMLLETLSLFAEIYVTALVAGPLFLLVILVMLGVIGGVQMGSLCAIIYIFIPVGSAMFIFLVKITGMGDESSEIIFGTNKNKAVKKESESATPEEKRRIVAMRKADSKIRFNHFLHHPFDGLKRNPFYILIISVPAALILLIPNLIRVWGFPLDTMAMYIDDYIVISTLIALVPFVIFYEWRSYYIKKVNSAIPEFLKRLANLNQSGLSVPKALHALLKSNLGVLNDEIRRISNQIEWGSSTTEALEDFTRRIGTRTSTRLVTLINRAAVYTSDLRETLTIAASDAMTTENLRKERYAGTLMYVMIIYISFAVFLYIIYILASVFMPMLPGSTDIPASGAQMFSLGTGAEIFNMLFYHSCLIMGFSSGLVSGQIANGNMFLGFKHSIIMVVITFITFNILIT